MDAREYRVYFLVLSFSRFDDISRNDKLHDLVGTFKNSVDSKISKISFDSPLGDVTVSSVHLECLIDDIETIFCSIVFGHGCVDCFILGVIVDLDGGCSDHESGGDELGGHLTQLELEVLEFV